MMAARISQLDQITELTRGVTLPLAAIGEDVLAIILEAVADAWRHVKLHYGQVLREGSEAEISALLVSRLNASLGWNATLRLFVSSVDRGSETVSFNGAKLEGRPDLLFTLTMQDTRFRLTGECKIIDVPNRKTPALYRDNGIARFVGGDYAWANREAIMVAYVRCGAQLDSSLLNGLGHFTAMNCSTGSLQADCRLPIEPGTLGRSTHHRTFSYIHQTSAAPGQIELWHLWLQV